MEQFIQKPPRTKACYILNLPGLSPALKSWHVFNADAERKYKIGGAIRTEGKQFESKRRMPRHLSQLRTPWINNKPVHVFAVYQPIMIYDIVAIIPILIACALYFTQPARSYIPTFLRGRKTTFSI